MPNYKAIIRMFQDLQDQANEANEARYKQILDQLSKTQGQVGGTYDQIQELLGTLGGAERERIGRQAEIGRAQTLQSLVDRGLGSTTIKESMERRIDEEESRAMLALEEALAGQQAGALMSRAGAEERLGGLIASMMESRSDVGPDMGSILSLMQSLGAGEGAMAGGAGGYGGGSGGGGSLGSMWMGQRFGGGGGGGERTSPYGAPMRSGGGYGGGATGGGAGPVNLFDFFGPGSKGFFGEHGSVEIVDPEQAGEPSASMTPSGGGGEDVPTLAERIWERIRKGI